MTSAPKTGVKRNPLYFLYIIADFAITAVIVGMSFLSFARTSDLSSTQIIGVVVYVVSLSLATILMFLMLGIYKMLTRNFGLPEAIKIAITVLSTHLVGLIFLLVVPNEYLYRMSIWGWALSVLCLMFILSSLRLASRIFNLIRNIGEKRIKIRTLVIGAGASAKVVIDETRNNKSSKSKIVVVVDDDFNKVGGTLSNIPVKGPISEVSNFISQYDIEEVIIAISNLSSKRFHEIFGYLETCSVRIKKIPLLSEMQGPNDIKVTTVDLEDLLFRSQIQLDNKEVENLLRDSSVLVTGAGGSIGSELVRQIFNARPKTIILFDIYENNTYDIQQELLQKARDKKADGINIVTLIGSTYNEVRVEQVIRKYRPDYIYHAAAYKHVPLMEDSPIEAIRTNVVGTYNVAKMADRYKVKKMIFVSTDKAVRPTNVMGATKRLAEMIIQHYSCISQSTLYSSVRFGNVLGSSGSVVPLFRKQIEAGGPITITHKDIIRYFMTIPEAVGLILQCSLFAKGGEIFILDMGKPIKILSLAEKLIRNAGFVPYKDIKIIETGLRPGEKLFEELLIDKEHQVKTANEKIFIEKNDLVCPIENDMEKIAKAFNIEESEDIKDLLSQIITSYQRKI